MATLQNLPRKALGRPPAPPQPCPRALKRLEPMGETIGASKVYENKRGERFTAGYERLSGLLSENAIISIKRIGGPDEIIALVTISPEVAQITSIHETDRPIFAEPDSERKGYGFFRIILEETKGIAAREGCSSISILPVNDRLGQYYGKFGFIEGDGGEMRLDVPN